MKQKFPENHHSSRFEPNVFSFIGKWLSHSRFKIWILSKKGVHNLVYQIHSNLFLYHKNRRQNSTFWYTRTMILNSASRNIQIFLTLVYMLFEGSYVQSSRIRIGAWKIHDFFIDSVTLPQNSLGSSTFCKGLRTSTVWKFKDPKSTTAKTVLR